MTVELLHRVRRSTIAATQKEIDDLREDIEESAGETPPEREKPDFSKDAEDLGLLISKCVKDRDNDKQSMARELASARGKGRAHLEKVNRSLQKIFTMAISLHGSIQQLARLLGTVGYRVNGLEQLNQATEEYRRWIDNLPERVAMEDPRVKKILQDRFAEALKNPARESDWRKHFADEEEASGQAG